jgi:hypothetical protein
MSFKYLTLQTAVALSLGLFAATSVNAALVGVLGGQAINDADLNVTWLADANYAKTSGYSATGMMTWIQAQSWIASMNAENGGAGHLGYHDWRLPTTLQSDESCGSQQSNGVSYGYNCNGSEMGHLFYSELDGVAFSNIATTYNANYSLFSNVQANRYWSVTEYAPNTDSAWSFGFNLGSQDSGNKSRSLYVLAVRPGQIAPVTVLAAAAVPVPVPAAAWIFGSGLLGLAGVARRRLVLR